jgi:hypothetical protein
LLNSEKNPERSVARNDDSSNADRPIKIIEEIASAKFKNSNLTFNTPRNMILSDTRILEEIEKGTIKIVPYDRECLAVIPMMYTWAKHWPLTKNI